MQWLLFAVAAVMAIANLWAYSVRRQYGDLFRGIAWVGFTCYLAWEHPWLLYISIALFVIGLFSRRQARTADEPLQQVPDEQLPRLPADDHGEDKDEGEGK